MLHAPRDIFIEHGLVIPRHVEHDKSRSFGQYQNPYGLAGEGVEFFGVPISRQLVLTASEHSGDVDQGRSQEFDLGGYKCINETKQPRKKLR